MRIYRVEMPSSGAGPYSPHLHGIREWEWQVESELDRMYWDHKYDDDNHPTPFFAGEMPGVWDVYDIWDFRCGFESENQLVQWFGEWMTKLDELGFRVSTYEVPPGSVLTGQHQLIFDKLDARLVGYDHLPLTRMEMAA